jgi:hypothetical protein
MKTGSFAAWGWKAALFGLVLATGFGCGPGTWWHLLKGDQSKNAQFPLTPHNGKSEVTVAVSVTAQHGVPTGVDLDLASKFGEQLKVLSAANKGTPIKAFDQTKVNAFVTNYRDEWSLGNPGEFAKRLGVDYWIDVTVSDFSLMDKEFGNEICRGRATLEVSVYEAGEKKPKYQYPLMSQAPLRPTEVAKKSVYRGEYIGKLATELAFKHVDYKADQERALMK